MADINDIIHKSGAAAFADRISKDLGPANDALAAFQKSSLLTDHVSEILAKNAQAVSGLSAVADAARGLSKTQALVDAAMGGTGMREIQKIAQGMSSAAEAHAKVMDSFKIPEIERPEYTMPALTIARSPVHKTNETLDELVERIEQTNDLLNGYIEQSSTLLNSLNTTLVEMAARSSLDEQETRQTLGANLLSISTNIAEDSKGTRNQNRFMIILAVASLVVTAVFSWWTWKQQAGDISNRDLKTAIEAQTQSNQSLLKEIMRSNDLAQKNASDRVLRLEKQIKTQIKPSIKKP